MGSARWPGHSLVIPGERLVELVPLIIVALPLARIAGDAGLQRRFAAFPPIWPLLPIALVTYAVGVTAAFVYAPALLRTGAVIAAGLIVYELLQRRARAGAAQGVPPGSLAFFPAGPWRDPDYFRKEAERWGPVFKFRHLSRPAVAIVGLENISAFLQSKAADVSSPPAPFNAILPGGFVRYLRDNEHLDTAAMLRSAMSRTVVDKNTRNVVAESRIAIDSLRRDARSAPRVIDTMMLHVMMRCFLGLERGPDLDRLAALYERADYRMLAKTGRARARRAILEIIREMRVLAAREDLSPSFLSELQRAHPHAVGSDAVMGSFAYALHTARVDASGLMVWVLAVAGENPHWIASLRADTAANPDASETNGLADRMVRETLRMRQSEFIIRRANRQIDFMGYLIPQGWHVRLCVAESHRSAGAFADPERFDPDRFLKTPTRQRYAPFGFAPHLCPGEHLTRWIGRKFLVELAVGHDMRATNVKPWEFGGFHWRPNAAMAIHLTPVRT
jgi:cytochrome P450